MPGTTILRGKEEAPYSEFQRQLENIGSRANSPRKGVSFALLQYVWVSDGGRGEVLVSCWQVA